MEELRCREKLLTSVDAYQSIKVNVSRSITEVKDEHLFLQVVGGMDKKRTVGLVSELRAYYKRSNPSGPSSDTFTSYTPLSFPEWRARLKKSKDERQATREGRA